MERAVIDNNVLISGILKKDSPPGQIVKAAQSALFVVIASDPLIEEFERVADRLSPKYPQIVPHKDAIINFLLMHSIGNPPHLNPPVVTQDPDDGRVLECALAGHAGYIVSGNRHLTSLQEFRGIPILRPVAFLQRLYAPLI